MKRSFNESFEKSKRSRSDNDGPEIRFLIPSRAAGALIGKGGETVKRLRSDYQAEISIPDGISPERCVYICAPDMEKIYDVSREVLRKVEEVNRGNTEEPEIKLLIHQSQAGAVIGRSGTRIKELRESTGTGIKVYDECAPMSTERVVSIMGQEDKVIAAIREVTKILSEVPIRGPRRPYEPANYDPDFVEEYGGYRPDGKFKNGPPSRFGGGGRGGFGGGGRGGFGGRGAFGGGGGFGGGFGRGGHDDMMDHAMGFGARPRSSAMNTGNSFEEFLASRGINPYKGLGGPRVTMLDFDDENEIAQQQVTIPKDLAGSIIGKGGDRIARIRNESGAKIVVREADGDSDERIITIMATPMRIQYAQFLLQQCVKASASGRRYIFEANR